MNTDNSATQLDYLEDNEDDDAESLASLESDDGIYPPEKVVAEYTAKNGYVWFLVKWQDCPLIRSSWECTAIFDDSPWILRDWQIEKQKQAEGKSEPLDIAAFNRAVADVELAERQRRTLRRLKRHVKNVLAAIAAT
jgi:hypothetical protein